MGDFSYFGKLLISIGGTIVLIGFIILIFSKIWGIGKLPGDILFQKGNFTFYFPIASSIILSIVISLFLNFIIRK